MAYAFGSASFVHAQALDYDPRRPIELKPCDDHQYHGRSAEARRCYQELADATQNLIVEAETAWALGDLQRANELFKEITRANDRASQPRVRWGRLFAQTHQYSDAVEVLKQALEIFPDDVHAKLALARVFVDQFEGQARTLVDEILKQDDSLYEAHLLDARMRIEQGQVEEAEDALQRATDIANQDRQPPLELYTLQAGLALQRNRDVQPWVRRALDYNPRYGGVYEQLAHFEIMRRRYREATNLLERAVELQPDLWSAQEELGSNLLRLGELARAREHLTAAYGGDPFSPTTVNSLRLLDRMDDFVLTTTKLAVPAIRGSGDVPVELRLRMNKKEADALRPYATALARDSIAAFSRRYAFELAEPVTVEIFNDHDDFAVRVAALPGIGLLGVTFGYLVAMDSPSGRATGEFHWGSTLWHEMAHVFTLEATDHRVPRWLSEGISVFEEWRTGPTPGVAVPADFIGALKEDKLLGIAALDSGFIRPSYPNQVQVSYMQAGMVCLFIEQRFGFDKLVGLLKQFTRDTTTAQAIEATFKMKPAEFDAQFAKFMETRYAALLPRLEEWERAYQKAAKAVASQQWSEALEPAQLAVELYPENVGADSPHLLLVRTFDKLNRRADAIKALEAFQAAGGWDPDALRTLAKWYDEANRKDDANQLLYTINYGDPLAPDQHVTLGERLLASNKADEALREYRVLLALKVHDEAAANFGAAQASRALGDRTASRRYLLDALAVAPHFKPAQELLLETIEERKNND